MVCAIQVGNVDLFLMNVNPADGTIIKHEPRFHSKSRLPPGKFEDGAHQSHEEPPMTDQCNAVLGLSLLVSVTCD